ncbi:unnamed protein product [Rhizoctonia solani]|uniref:Uncharacterized protein n=1 Tax=Rhizoctonia solani TaxID=456999 RepID=A0A8H3AKB9_9AGAM|nr:unnamed protein product [Rhizoctonia solani]
MSSDYDYDDDDLLLDDDALRKLSEVEDKCGVAPPKTGASNATSLSTVSKRGENPPPPKRTKVTQPVPATQSDDDTPDIFVNADGTYALDSPGPSVLSLAPSFIQPSTAISRGLSRNGISFTQQPSQSQMQVDNSSRDPDAKRLQSEVEALRAQLAKAESEREGLRISLQQNKEVTFAKAGEAENLRRTMSKQTEQHAEEMTRLRHEMVEMEKAKVALEVQMKQDMDRFRTELAFKQDPIRKGFPNVNSTIKKRQIMGSSHTPQSTQALSRAAELQSSPLSPTKRPARKAMGPRSSHTPQSTQALSRAAELQSSPLSPTKRPARKAMGPRAPPEDSFDDHEENSIWPGSSRFQDKGKGKGSTTWRDDTEYGIGPARSLKFEEPEYWRSYPVPATQPPFAPEPDVFGANSQPKTPMKSRGEANPNVEVTEPVDLAEELRMLLLAHVILFDSSEAWKAFSLQTVLTASIPDFLRQRFDTACTSLFNAFSGWVPPLTGEDGGNSSAWDYSARKASLALAQLAQIFQEAGLLDSLHVLVNLLTSISATIPTFARYLLEAGTKDRDSLILEVVCDTIVKFFKKPLDSGDAWHLAESMLGLCEALASHAKDDCVTSHAKDDCVTRFSILSRRVEVLPILLDLAQPPPWSVRVTRLLAVLGSKPLLSRALLSFPDANPPATKDLARVPLLDFPDANPPATKDLARVPLLECLCRHLTAFRKHNMSEHYRELYENILTALAQLAIADTQILTILVDSPSLILSLVFFIYHVTSAIWSEVALAENATGNHETCLVQNLRSAVQLLHYLVFSPNPTLNVRERLLYATRGPFNGTIHFFIVSFGRLAFGDPPEYLDTNCCKAIREIRGLSEALLETVVDGPEVDGIYVVFRDSDEDDGIPSSGEKVEASVADEEEALHMAIDDDEY